MVKKVDNLFTSYQYESDEEELVAALIPLATQQLIQSEISRIATQKTFINYNPANPMEFVQQEAEFKGQIISLMWLLDAAKKATSYFAVDPASSSNPF